MAGAATPASFLSRSRPGIRCADLVQVFVVLLEVKHREAVGGGHPGKMPGFPSYATTFVPGRAEADRQLPL